MIFPNQLVREREGVALESKSADGVDWRRTHWHKLCLTPPAGGKLFLTDMAKFWFGRSAGTPLRPLNKQNPTSSPGRNLRSKSSPSYSARKIPRHNPRRKAGPTLCQCSEPVSIAALIVFAQLASGMNKYDFVIA